MAEKCGVWPLKYSWQRVAGTTKIGHSQVGSHYMCQVTDLDRGADGGYTLGVWISNYLAILSREGHKFEKKFWNMDSF